MPKSKTMLPGPQNRKVSKDTIKRLLGYLSAYKLQLVLVTICILLSAVASVVSSLFLRTLIDDYIAPLLLQAVPDFSGLFRVMMQMAMIFLVGIVATFLYNRIMVVAAQGVRKTIRDEMFAHMQTLSIKYFDTHTHGDIMSHYTNDTDTLRQMIAQSLPQVFSSIVTVTAVFIAMLSLSVWLTLFVVICVFLIMKLVGYVTGKSGTYFVRQQQSLGSVNGYIEEMINGQKVVKVFCHEEQAKQEFDRRNQQLCQNATEANKFANILMPIMNNMGYVLYVLLAVIGGAMGLAQVPNLSLSGSGVLT